MSMAEAIEALARIVHSAYQDKEARLGSEEILRSYERVAILQIIDSAWKRHLLVMDHLKEAIGFRGYGQKDPLVEYKRESYEYFEQMRFGYEDEIISYLYRVEPQPAYVPEEDTRVPGARRASRSWAPTSRAPSPSMGLNGEPVQRVMRFSAGGIDND